MYPLKAQRGGAYPQGACPAGKFALRVQTSLICIKNYSPMNEEYRGDAPLQKKYTADFLARSR